MAVSDCIGPVLVEVGPGDDEGLRFLFQEQRARMAFVQENALWDWFGGVPFGMGSPRAGFYGVVLALAIVGAMAAVLLTAGFTRGPVLWTFAALVPVLWLVRYFIYSRHARRTVRFYRAARLVPAVVVARVPDSESPNLPVWNVFALVDPAAPEPKSLRALLAAGKRMRAYVDGTAVPPAALAEVVTRIRAGGVPATFDGSRADLPREAGEGLELARFFVSPVTPAGESHESHLVFVLADPERRAPGHTRPCAAALWGPAAEQMCAALPWEVRS